MNKLRIARNAIQVLLTVVPGGIYLFTGATWAGGAFLGSLSVDLWFLWNHIR